MSRVRIGIPAHEGTGYVRSTIDSLGAAGHAATLVLLSHYPGAASFNGLVESGDADVYVLLEPGARIAAGWLDRLLATLAADPHHGLAGPSTNLGWNRLPIKSRSRMS